MKKAYLVGSVIFGIVAILHLLRLFYPTEIMIGDWDVPMWVSLVAFLVAGTLSGFLLRGALKSND